MATRHNSAAFLALLADLSKLEPRYGFLTPSELPLTDVQVADVLESEPEAIVADLAPLLPRVAEQLRIASRYPMAFDAIAALVVTAIRERARAVTLRELVSYCDAKDASEGCAPVVVMQGGC